MPEGKIVVENKHLRVEMSPPRQGSASAAWRRTLPSSKRALAVAVTAASSLVPSSSPAPSRAPHFAASPAASSPAAPPLHVAASRRGLPFLLSACFGSSRAYAGPAAPAVSSERAAESREGACPQRDGEGRETTASPGLRRYPGSASSLSSSSPLLGMPRSPSRLPSAKAEQSLGPFQSGAVPAPKGSSAEIFTRAPCVGNFLRPSFFVSSQIFGAASLWRDAAPLRGVDSRAEKERLDVAASASNYPRSAFPLHTALAFLGVAWPRRPFASFLSADRTSAASVKGAGLSLAAVSSRAVLSPSFAAPLFSSLARDGSLLSPTLASSDASSSSFSPFLRSFLLLAAVPLLASSLSPPSSAAPRQLPGLGVARCDEKPAAPPASSFFRGWFSKSAPPMPSPAVPAAPSDAAPLARAISSAPAAAGATTAQPSAWGTAEGGGLLRWRGGGVGRWSEPANAPIEDRSFAVLLAIDGQEDAAESGEAGEGDFREAAEPSDEETVRLAALVFPGDVAALVGREVEPVEWMRERKRKMKEKHQARQAGHPPEGKKKFHRQKVLLTAVIDGHGGPQVAEYVMQNLPWHVERELTALRRAFLKKGANSSNGEASSMDTSWLTNDVLTKAVSQAFRTLDDEIYQSARSAYRLGLQRSIRVGACCTAVLVTDRSLVVANSGDCKAILSRRHGAEVQALNEQLNANSPTERQRLREEHPNEDNVVVCKHSWQEQRKPSSAVDIPLYYAGLLGSTTFYSGCYVKGRLQPTRAFGDFLLKKSEFAHELQRPRRANGQNKNGQQSLSYPYLTVDPVVAHFDLRGDEDFVALGSDGVWDFLDDAESAHAIHASLQRTKQRAANTLQKQPATGAAAAGDVSDPSVSLDSAPSARGGVAPHVTSQFSAAAARLAATDLVKAVLQKAADERAISVDEMKSQDPKLRRRMYDDTTAIVVLLGQDWRPRPAPTKERR
ncbi:protein phosphatase 2C domain-containing protein [Besnoitia besnoiti]|uniref:Protein phosphatase 2C domain-containing protein n=1 Tax=Besnoitia besnoiti TaxID=94643 RepID=A0A2A9MNL2_BESBE|nr:protein phosphatase 2C domain-containing protein [Besnoitia besnoiti]PFH37487.1 protein phosphatase 2C domain-containing protein [Besnoitia besnoiti]